MSTKVSMFGKVTRQGGLWLAVRKTLDGDRVVVERLATPDKATANHFMINGGSEDGEEQREID